MEFVPCNTSQHNVFPRIDFTSNAGDFSNGMNTPQPTDSFLGENCTEEHMVVILEHEGGVAASLD